MRLPLPRHPAGEGRRPPGAHGPPHRPYPGPFGRRLSPGSGGNPGPGRHGGGPGGGPGPEPGLPPAVAGPLPAGLGRLGASPYPGPLKLCSTPGGAPSRGLGHPPGPPPQLPHHLPAGGGQHLRERHPPGRAELSPARWLHPGLLRRLPLGTGGRHPVHPPAGSAVPRFPLDARLPHPADSHASRTEGHSLGPLPPRVLRRLGEEDTLTLQYNHFGTTFPISIPREEVHP